jgi:hypothetical protein
MWFSVTENTRAILSTHCNSRAQPHGIMISSLFSLSIILSGLSLSSWLTSAKSFTWCSCSWFPYDPSFWAFLANPSDWGNFLDYFASPTGQLSHERILKTQAHASEFQHFILFIIIIILLLYWGYSVTFIKVLTIYHSWIHSLHHSPLSLPSPFLE